MRLRLLATAMLSSALVLAACGGGGSSSTSTSKASGPTRAQYIASTASVCKETEQKIAPMVKRLGSAPEELLLGGSAAKIADIVEQLYSIAATGLARLRALPQPTGDHARIAKFLTPLSTIVDSIASAASGLKKGEGPQALATLAADQAVAKQVTRAARSYGLHQCESIFSALG